MLIDNEVIYTNQSATMLEKKKQLLMELNKQQERQDSFYTNKKKIIKLNIVCSNCEENIDNEKEDFYYQCAFHKTIFCYKCARNYNKREINKYEAPKCRQNPLKPHVDCVYEKKEIENA